MAMIKSDQSNPGDLFHDHVRRGDLLFGALMILLVMTCALPSNVKHNILLLPQLFAPKMWFILWLFSLPPVAALWLLIRWMPRMRKLAEKSLREEIALTLWSAENFLRPCLVPPWRRVFWISLFCACMNCMIEIVTTQSGFPRDEFFAGWCIMFTIWIEMMLVPFIMRNGLLTMFMEELEGKLSATLLRSGYSGIYC